MSVCAACTRPVSWDGAEMIDPDDGAPHRLTCTNWRSPMRKKTTGQRYCPYCARETLHEVTTDRRSELQRCLGCFRGREIRPIGRAGARR